MIVVDFMFYLHKIHRDHGTARDRGMRSTTILERRWRGARAGSWNGAGVAPAPHHGTAHGTAPWPAGLPLTRGPITTAWGFRMPLRYSPRY